MTTERCATADDGDVSFCGVDTTLGLVQQLLRLAVLAHCDIHHFFLQPFRNNVKQASIDALRKRQMVQMAGV
jgi:hypothetical protein